MDQLSKKQIILVAAAKLFRDKGYSATSMRDLAAAVDLKASSLYNHIGSKQEILKEICLDNAQKFSAGLLSIEEQNITALEKIKCLIELHVKIALEDVTSITSFNDEWRQLEEPHLSTFLKLRKDYESKFYNLIKLAQSNNEIKVIDPTICLYTILSSTRWVYDYQQQSNLKSSREIEESVVEIVLRGMAC